MPQQDKGDQLIWWLMMTAVSILIIGGGAWAANINSKVERIAALEINVQYIQTDIGEIKKLIQIFLKP